MKIRTTSPSGHRPIGFWVKLVDRLIDESFDQILAQQELGRRHWQTLNLLASGSQTVERVDEQLRPFLDDSQPTSRPVLDQLIERGWAKTAGGHFELTDEGTKTLADLAKRVAAYRGSISAGLGPDEYQLAVSVLERMATNLGWSEDPGAL